jgi:hypothetical protein
LFRSKDASASLQSKPLNASQKGYEFEGSAETKKTSTCIERISGSTKTADELLDDMLARSTEEESRRGR